MGENLSQQIKELIDFLNTNTVLYDEGHPIISDKEWDDAYFKLKQLEEASGIKFKNSPTQSIHFESVDALKKVIHNHEMLSLEKTKSLDDVKDFLGNDSYITMCKMDGLTCSLRYLNGKLVSAETRGDGKIGEDILHNAKVIPSIPKRIPFNDELIVDGEVICTYDDFEQFKNEYKNPRNFASGSIRLLNNKECNDRHLTFIAWDVIKGLDDYEFLHQKFSKLMEMNFQVVPWIVNYNLNNGINEIKKMAQENSYPIDGIVYKFDSIAHSKTLGKTAHHFKNAIAYKFYDETYPTELLDIEWTMGRTGVLTPIAIFKPIKIDGSIISRASLHNVSIMHEIFGLYPYKHQEIEIYKANMIIPQIANAKNIITDETQQINSDYYAEIKHISKCPCCGEELIVKTSDNGILNLICPNPNCEGKFINKLDHFCGKKGLDIKGLSKATLNKLMNWGWLNSYEDLFKLSEHSTEWKQKSGFGDKSVENILNAINTSRKCNLSNFIAALGIPLIGSTASKDLANHFKTWTNFMTAIDANYHFWELPNFGLEMHRSIIDFDYKEAKILYDKYLSIQLPSEEKKVDNNLDGKSIVITGKLTHFKNRDALKTIIEEHGGKVSSAVSGKTSYLINNDVNSTSSKNVAAKKNNVPIISEEKFIEIFSI